MANTQKLISVLGDSISTFDGYTPPGGVYYGPSFGSITGVYTPEDTWWMQVIRALDGALLANNSWSGSTVSMVGSLPACSPSRIRKLAAEGMTPDHILILAGLNDVNIYASCPIVTMLEARQKSDNNAFLMVVRFLMYVICFWLSAAFSRHGCVQRESGGVLKPLQKSSSV